MTEDAQQSTTGGAYKPPITALVITDPNEPHPVSETPFEQAGVAVIKAGGFDEACARFSAMAPGLVFVPVALEGRSVRQILDVFLSARPRPTVIVIASNDQINAAAEAMRAGAFDCLFRPYSDARLAKLLTAALKANPPQNRAGGGSGRASPRVTTAKRAAPIAQGRAGAPQGLIAASAQMDAVLDRISAVAPSDVPVFISGELGTGKTLLARALHDRSRRAAGAFLSVDCAALTPSLVEATLAGPGGALARATHGTLLLREITDLTPEAQTLVLQALDGFATFSAQDPSGPRLVTTTRRDPRRAILNGQLSSDLFYRLHVAPIEVPPLRRRRADIAPLAKAKLDEIASAEGRAFSTISDEALAVLEHYDWPGNGRELTNVIWSVVLVNEGPEVTADMLPPELKAPPRPDTTAAAATLADLVGKSLEEIERAVIEATIRSEGGSLPRAARVLGVAPSTLYRKREAWEKGDER